MGVRKAHVLDHLSTGRNEGVVFSSTNVLDVSKPFDTTVLLLKCGVCGTAGRCKRLVNPICSNRPAQVMIIMSPPLLLLALHPFLVLLTICLGIGKHHLWPFPRRLTIEGWEAAVNAALRVRSAQRMKSLHVVAKSRCPSQGRRAFDSHAVPSNRRSATHKRAAQHRRRSSLGYGELLAHSGSCLNLLL